MSVRCEAPACTHPTVRRPQSGTKEAVVLLHGSAGSSALWKDLRGMLAPAYDVITPDLIGYGAAPAWTHARGLTLEDESLRVEASIPCCEADFHVVGYSYGGAVALALALSLPARVKSLTLIEPVLFAALDRGKEVEALAVLRGIQERFATGMNAGREEDAMRDFIDFWSGEGAWSRLPSRHRSAALSVATKVRLDWEASFAFDPRPSDLNAIGARTLLVRGDLSPEPMIRLVGALHRRMPGSELKVISGAGHLLPVTHGPALFEAVFLPRFRALNPYREIR